MRLRSTDFLLCRLAHAAPGVFEMLGSLETDFLGSRLERIEIDRPVFIAGVARSGTTIVLDAFSRLEPVGTHRYRDFPFLLAPCWWSWCNERLARDAAPTERPHKDRIRITKESPDAFEEPIWRHFFPTVSDPGASHVLDAEHTDARFDEFFSDHLRKILLLRGKTRYVSKGNYNITRLRYIGRLFPDARFVIPVRHPVDHVGSLVRQHRLFTEYSAQDGRVPAYLRAAGHFEFGPQRMPINVEPEATGRVVEAWAGQDDALGYAVTWRAVYEHAVAAGQDERLRGRIRFVRYEDLCADPRDELAGLFAFCGLDDDAAPLLAALPEISPPKRDTAFWDRAAERIWTETAAVATRFGYLENGARPVGSDEVCVTAPQGRD